MTDFDLDFPFGYIKKSWLSLTVKRAFDIVVSFLVLLFFSPLFGIIALAIKRDSKGPVFYHGRRMGKDGKVFRIHKYRTMYERPESYQGAIITAHDDDRITPIGKWLRDTKLNELPQFWNVLVGEMSLVGPRPEDPELADEWPAKAKLEILSYKPGITSPATVIYNNEEAMLFSKDVIQKYIKEIGPNKLRLDQLYAHYHSFLLDLDVLLWTGLILIPRLRENIPPEELLFIGPFTRLVRRYMSWFTSDMIVTFLSVSAMALLWRTIAPFNLGILRASAMALLFSLLFSIIGIFFGIYRINWSKAPVSSIFNLLPSWIISTVIALIVNHAFDGFPASLVLASSTVALWGFIFIRYFKFLLRNMIYKILHINEKTSSDSQNVLIVGAGRTAEQISILFAHPTNISRYNIIGFIDNDMFSQGMRIYGNTVIGRFKDIQKSIETYKINLLVLADHRLDLEACKQIEIFCQKSDVKMVVIPDIFGSLHNGYHGVSNESLVPILDDDKMEFACQYCIIKNHLYDDEKEPRKE
ncbi:MAG: sugar transferase [Anaerolineaceae bacterium]|nr:sugar transferase [Anaerolineaceae bacterium]